MKNRFQAPRKRKQQSKPEILRHGIDFKLPFKRVKLSGQRITEPQRVLFDILRHKLLSNQEGGIQGFFALAEDEYERLGGKRDQLLRDQINGLSALEVPFALTKPHLQKFAYALRRRVVLYNKIRRRFQVIGRKVRQNYEYGTWKHYSSSFEESLGRYLKGVVPFLRLDFLYPGEIEKINLLGLLKAIPMAELENVSISCPEHLEITGIENIFYDVFNSIVSNSIQHGKSSKLLINVEIVPGKTLISFFNNGERISAGLLKKINTPGSFTRKQKAVKGFGTAIARESVEMFHGTYAVENLSKNAEGWNVVHRIVLPKKK